MAGPVETYASEPEAQARLRQVGAVFVREKSSGQIFRYWSAQHSVWIGAQRAGRGIRLTFSGSCGC
mgnify:CR=1 FL=1